MYSNVIILTLSIYNEAVICTVGKLEPRTFLRVGGATFSKRVGGWVAGPVLRSLHCLGHELRAWAIAPGMDGTKLELL